MAYIYDHYPAGSYIGTGTYQFQHFGDEGIPISVPTVSGTYTYNGTTQTVQFSHDVGYTVYSGGTGLNAGDYTAILRLLDGYKWDDGTRVDKGVDWYINKKNISDATITLDSDSKTYTGETQSVTITAITVDNISVTTYTTGGSTSGINAGTYTITATGKTNFTGTASKEWEITKATGTLSISPTSVAFNSSALTATVTATSNCLGTLNMTDLTGITKSISNNIITLTADGTTTISGAIMTVSVTPDENHTTPSNVDLSVSATYSSEYTGKYKFYNASGVEITPVTIETLVDAASYSFDGGAQQSLWTTAGKTRIFYWDPNKAETSEGGKFYLLLTQGTTGLREWNSCLEIGGTSTEIGTGSANTLICLDNSSKWGSYSIWEQVQSYRTRGLQGFYDWFVPSIDELEQLRQSGVKSDWLDASRFWSSSEAGDSTAWGIGYGAAPSVYDKQVWDGNESYAKTVLIRTF